MSHFLPIPPIPEDPFAIVKEGRAVLKTRQSDRSAWVKNERKGKVFSERSEKTEADYQRDVDRLIKKGGNLWESAADTTKLSTWLKRKSAILFIAEREVERLLKVQDKLQRGKLLVGSAELKDWVDALDSLHFYSSVLSTQPAPESKPLETVERRESKRRGLSKLPGDWREQLAKRLPTWRMPYLVAACTGARPSEIGRGIDLKIDGEDLVATIKGAKVGPYSGQKLREMRWSIERGMPELVRQLAKKVNEAGGRLLVDYSGHDNPNPEKAFSGAMRQAAGRAFPGQKVTLTPYSLRHAAASDLKASGLTGQQQSAALGHQVVETKGSYGHHRLARGRSVAPKRVRATTPVRGVPTKPPGFSNKPGPSTGQSKAAKPR